MPKSKKTIPIYEYSEKINGQTRYYIRPYINGKQITKRLDDSGNMWLGRDGYINALNELTKIENQLTIISLNKKRITNNELYEMFINDKKNKIDEDTLVMIQHRLINHFLNTEGEKKIYNYSKEMYKKWQDNMLEATYIKAKRKYHYSLSFLNAIHSYINAMYEYALDNELIKYNPINRIGKFGTRKQIANQKNERHYKIISYDDYLKLLAATSNDIKFNTLFDLFFSNGPRPGELMAFRWCDYDYKNAMLYVNHTISKKVKGRKRYLKEPKTPSSKAAMPLDEQLNEKLHNWKKICMENNNFNDEWFIFGKENPISENSLCWAVQKYFKIANIEKIRLHDFRHSFASWLLSLKIPITVISKRMRHASIEETMKTYIHLIPKDYFDSINYINEIKNKTTIRPEDF